MMAQWYLALSNPRVQALRLQQTGRKNGRNVAIIAPLYQLPAQEAGAPIRTYHDRIVDGMVNLIHLAGISNFTVEDTQILQPVADAQTIARLERGASKKAHKEIKNSIKTGGSTWFALTWWFFLMRLADTKAITLAVTKAITLASTCKHNRPLPNAEPASGNTSSRAPVQRPPCPPPPSTRPALETDLELPPLPTTFY